MAERELEKTSEPGIFKRGGRYVVTYRVNGRQRKEFARTMVEARNIRATRRADQARGEFQEATRLTLREYAEEWIDRYQGRGKGFRESTREEYRRNLRDRVLPQLGARKLTEITPRDVANFIGWLCDEQEQGRRLADATVHNAVKPLRACLETAVIEGLLRHNPTNRVPLPNRPRIEEGAGDPVQAFTREQLAAFLEVVNPRYRLLFRVLAATGLRISEAIALQWGDVKLDGSRPHVRVRRALVRGRLVPPKSRHGNRSVPLDGALVSDLRARRRDAEWPRDGDLVFASLEGTPLRPENLRRRTLRPVAEEVGAPWAGFHTFRHTCASLLFERGANVKQVQRWLGHHSPTFTLDTYVHLLADDAGEPLDLSAELDASGDGATVGATRGHETGRNQGAAAVPETAD